MTGVSVVVTPIKATRTVFGAVPTVWTTKGWAKSGGVQLLVQRQAPLTILAVT